MGKAQSKRSVDITTETKKGAEDEITEKMEKIEDIDKREVVNGDATIQENESEKKDTEDVENDKDMTTEKNVDAEASGDSVEQKKPQADESPKEYGSATAEELSPLADESVKKSKKEKVKKKWSFRSISFGKKDKQKPAKNEEVVEDGAVATNGASDEKTSPDTEESLKDQPSVNGADEKSTENHENGNATEQELIEHTAEKLNDVTAKTNINTTTETSSTVQIDTAVSIQKTEKLDVAAAVTIESETKVTENVTIDDDASKNGNGITEEINATEHQTTDASESVEALAEKKGISAEVTTEPSASTTNGDVVKVHQNGTNAESEKDVEQTNAQIEVNSNTDKVSAGTLDYISSTSIILPNAQVQAQDLNESSEKTDNNVVRIDDVVVDDEQQNNQKYINIGVENSIVLRTSSPPTLHRKDSNGNADRKTVVSSSEQPADTEGSSEENISDESSPPPLPISPPPSQVSMFAFTNNKESVKASIQIEKSESEPSPTINIYVEEEEKVPCATNTTALSKQISAEAIDNHPFISNEITTEEVVVENRTENKNIDGPADAHHYVHVGKNECKEEMPLKDADELSTTTGDESSLAAAVVDEITEKAVNIVNQQLENSENQICTELLEIDEQQLSLDASDGKQKTKGDRCNIEDTLDKTLASEFSNKVHIENKQEEAHTTTITNTANDTDAVLCEQNISSQESPMQITNDTDKECFLALSAPETVQQTEDGDVETISSNKSDILDAILEEHFNPTKEFANAKDLKENVAVAEITQDLSVTCE